MTTSSHSKLPSEGITIPHDPSTFAMGHEETFSVFLSVGRVHNLAVMASIPRETPELTYGRLNKTTPTSPYAIATFLTEDTYQAPDDYYLSRRVS